MGHACSTIIRHALCLIAAPDSVGEPRYGWSTGISTGNRTGRKECDETPTISAKRKCLRKRHGQPNNLGWNPHGIGVAWGGLLFLVH